MRWIVMLCLALLSAPAHAELRGTYVADASRSPEGSRGALEAIFQNTLHLHKDHRFTFAAIGIRGFWRMEGERVILVFATLFNRPYAVPDEVLKRSWPTNQMEGLVLRARRDGTLLLNGFGAAKGPVVFRRAPRVDTLTLLRDSHNDDPSKGEGAYLRLEDEMRSREGDLLAIIANPEVSIELRRWATYFFGPKMSAQALARATRLITTVSVAGLSERQRRVFLQALASNLADVSNPAIIEAVLKQTRAKVSNSTMAQAIGKAGYAKGIPLLVEWLASPGSYDRAYSADALAKLNVKEALPKIRELTKDPEPLVRIAAYGAILNLSTDQTERDAAIPALGSLLGEGMFGDGDVLKALGDSKSRLALPYVAHVLLTGNNRDRAEAAEQIGRLGFREGVPVLLEAKKTPGSTTALKKMTKAAEFEAAFSAMFDYSDVRKAVVEALYLFDRGARVPTRREAAVQHR